MKKINFFRSWLMLVMLLVGVGTTWADTYVQLTSIANIDESAEYVLGIDGTGFHKSGTSSWGVCTNSGGGTPLKYKLVKATDGKSFKASTEIGSTTYYLAVPTSNTFTMATSSTAANTDMIIGTTQVSGTNYAVANKGTTARHLRLNGTSGLRSYAGTTGTMAFFYKVVPDGPTVSSIAVKTAPTKTTYMVGETFDPAGLVITKNMSNSTTQDVAYSGNESSFTFSPSLSTELSNETSVSITYGGKTTAQAITVNPFVATAGTYTINTNNGLYGVSTGNNGTEQSKTKSGITIVSGCKSSATNKTYYDTDHIRYYADSYLKLTAPAGFEISQVVFTANGTWNSGPKCGTNGSYNNTTKTWQGSTSQLDLTFSDQNRIKTIAVTYAAETSAPEKELIGIGATGTPAEFWKGDEFNHNGITVTALWDDETETDVTSSCEFSGYNMSTAGEQTVTVTYQGETCQYGIEVKTIANTQETAYTVDQAKALIDAGKDLASEVYVAGTVSEIESYSSTYNSITYWISADGTTSNQFEVYSGKNLNNTNFSSKEDITVGDDVIIYGVIKKYNSTYEFDKNNYLVKWDKVATLSIADITVANGEDITPDIITNVTGEYAIEYTSDNEEVVLADGDELVTMGAGTAAITATLVADGYKTAETTFNVTVTTSATITSVTLSGELTNTTYTIGDAFDHTGLVATANYSDDSHVDVTETATWEVAPETLTTAGTVTVTVSASFGGQEDIQEYEVTVNKKTASITFAPATVDVEVGKNITLAPTTTPADAEISYTITEGDANVSLDGAVVTGVAEGTAIIRADFTGNDEYNAASTTVTINVIPADASITVTQTGFTSTSDNLVDDTNGEDANLSYEAFKGNASTAPAINSNNLRLYQNGAYVTIKGAAGVSISQVKITTSATYTSTTVGYCVDDEDAPTTGETVAKSSDYTITSLNNQSVSIYCLGTDKDSRLEIAAIEVKYTKEDIELSSIVLSGEYQTEFIQNQTFNHDGIEVTATFSNEQTEDVTAKATFSDPDMTTTGTKIITVSYTDAEITKTAEYEITVAAEVVTAIALSGTYQTTFHVGATFNYDNLVVKATYNSGRSNIDVTSGATVSTPDMSVAGEKTVTVSYGGQNANYTIKVLSANTIFYESFDTNNGTGGNDDQWSGSIAANNISSDNANWTFAYSGGANKCAKFGTGSSKGAATTPALGHEGVAIMTFKSAAWNGGSESLVVNLSVEGDGAISQSSITNKKGEWTEYTVVLTGLTNDSKVKFEAANASNNRFFLDEVLVRELEDGDYEEVRSVSEGEFGAICLTKKVVAFKCAKFYEPALRNNTDPDQVTQVDFTEVEVLEAGKPYVFLAESAGNIEVVYAGEAVAEAGTNNGLYGNFAKIEKAPENALTGNYIIYQNQLRKCGANCSLSANRAYLVMSEVPTESQAPARISLGIFGTNTATDLEALNAENGSQKIMIDGVLFILHNGKTYDSLGRLVK